MLQQITLTLLEAGQKSVDPPYKAVGEMIQGGVNLFAGGITWVDADYDERTGAALEPLLTNNPNLGWGVDREKRIAEIIAQGHFLNQIKLPDSSHARTAFEVEKMWQEFIRTTTPLFEPIQVEYNGAACDQTFELMLQLNAFGPIAQQMPPMLRGQNIKFQFDSPLTMAQDRADVQAFTAVGQITQLAVQMDPMVVHDLNLDKAYRDAVRGTGAPADWLIPKQMADAMKDQARQQQAQQQAQQEQMAKISQGADIGAKIGQAATMLSQGGVLPQNPPQNGGVT
jgi:Bacteriophage head to tail connecting protein